MKKHGGIKRSSLILSENKNYFCPCHRRGVSSIALLIFAAIFIMVSFSFASLKFSDKNNLGSGENLFSRASAVILKTLGGAFSSEEKKPVLEIDLGKNSGMDSGIFSEKNFVAPITPEKIPVESPKNSVAVKNEKSGAENFSTSSPRTENNPAAIPAAETQIQKKISDCIFSTAGVSNHQIIFSEINWAGDNESASNEWIEIKNNSGRALGLNGWQILSGDGNVKIIFKEENKISSGELYLLERTDDNSVPDVTADMIYSGALSNSGAALKIFDADCNLSDELDASKKWPAGNSAARKTMERSILDFSWHTSNSPGGTPKQENSMAFSTKGIEETSQLVDSPVGNQTTTSAAPDSQTQNQTTAHILIAGIQITGGSGKTTNDFIKIFNPSSAPFNLKGYRLIKRTKTGTSDTSIKSWTADAFIPAGGYYMWANSSFTALNPPADITTSGSIASDNSIAIRQGSENSGTIIDAVAWGAAQNGVAENGAYPLNPDANQILSRKSVNGSLQDTNNNQNDFEIK